ncbi:MAG: undecaprenyl-phosphate galactose phosphotransferase WbaP [Rickettsiales bacterium]
MSAEKQIKNNKIATGESLYSYGGNINKTARFYVISDVVAMFAGFAVAFLLALVFNSLFMERGDVFLANTYSISQIASFIIVSGGIVAWFASSGHYRVPMPFWMEVQKIVAALGFAMLLDGFLQFVTKQDMSRIFIISGWLLSAAFVIGFRYLVRKFSLKRGSFYIPTLVVGSGVAAENIKQALEQSGELGYKVVAQINNLPEVFLQSGRSWKNICESYEVDHVIIAMDSHDFSGTEKIMEKLNREDISFSFVPSVQGLPVSGMSYQYFINNNTALLTMDKVAGRNFQQFIKRAVDVFISGLALILLSPLMLVVSLFIKLDGGNVFFGHNRIGREGKVFPCLKFRSMVINGDEILKKHLENSSQARAEWEATQKLKDDPRVTKIGKFLRATSLDELPQLINVLRGDMSLVGPRPIVKNEIKHYDKAIAYYKKVRPGVTGLWQVSGRSDVSYGQRVQMDSWYVKNWSLWHDIVIMLKTFPAVIKRSGAY